MPPPSCDISMPRPASRGSRYCSCASSTCSWPSRVRAWRAKMSRMSCVRSITRTSSSRSRLRCCEGVSSWSKITRSGATRCDCAFQLLQLAAADERGGVGLLTPLQKLADDGAAGAGGQFAQFGHRLFRRKVARFFRVAVQVSGGGVCVRRERRQALFPEGSRRSPAVADASASASPVRNRPCVFLTLSRRPCEQFHSYQKHAFRLVPTGWPGTAIRPGVHSTCVE